MVYIMILVQKETSLQLQGFINKETDSLNSLESSLKSYPLWVTLYARVGL